MTETQEHRLKRMTMRSWRRGTKEMDLILGPYADKYLPGLAPDVLDTYDLMLEENDQDLYRWVTGQAPTPEPFSALMSEIRATILPQG